MRLDDASRTLKQNGENSACGRAVRSGGSEILRTISHKFRVLCDHQTYQLPITARLGDGFHSRSEIVFTVPWPGKLGAFVAKFRFVVLSTCLSVLDDVFDKVSNAVLIYKFS